MVTGFPWPVTDDELVLNNALASVISAYAPRGDTEDSYDRETAARLIIEAYNQGIRDPDVLANYALKALHGRDPTGGTLSSSN